MELDEPVNSEFPFNDVAALPIPEKFVLTLEVMIESMESMEEPVLEVNEEVAMEPVALVKPTVFLSELWPVFEKEQPFVLQTSLLG